MGVPTVLIGRAADLDEIDERLRSRRLVTLVGPGGVGKTAAARVAARGAAERFPLGVRFLDLARVDDPDAVAGTFAAQLGFTSVDALLNSPVDQPALVIADNCEHVIDAASSIIAELLDLCDMPTILATSRVPLNVPGESVVALAPLTVPATGDPEAAGAPTVQLFLERARDAGAVIRPDDLDAVVQVCRRLDGLPLAIEIAAARTRSMSVDELLGRLDDGIEVLARPRFRGASRHRSVGGLIQWSIDLLEPDVTELLDQLAVLHGSFTRRDASRLLGQDHPDLDLDAGIDALVEASLVSVDTGSTPTRYRLFETVRHRVLERMTERGVFDERFDRLADQVSNAVAERLRTANVRWDAELLRDMREYFDDIAASLRWCVAHDAEPRRAMGLCSALFAVVQQGRAAEIATLARLVLDRWPDAVRDQVPGALATLGTLATAENLTGRPQSAIALAETGLASTGHDRWATVSWWRALGQSRLALVDRVGAAEAFATGAVIARRLGLDAMALELELAETQLAVIDGSVGIDDALATLAAVRDEATASGSELSAIWASTSLAWTMLRRSPSAAIGMAQAALDEARAVDYPTACFANLRTIAFAHLAMDDRPAAAAAVTALHDEVGDRKSLTHARMVVDAAAALARRCGDPSWRALAATVDTLPPATVLASPGDDDAPSPPSDGTPLTIRDALRTVRHVAAAAESATEPAGSDPEPAGRPTMRRRGDVWELSFAGRAVSLRASKGLADLATLLTADGREVHCLDLVGAGARQDSTGEVVDAAARRQYEQRIRDLQADIDDAEAHHDIARAERAQAEFDILVDHLAAAIGHGGRTRRAADTAERARSTVTQRVRTAMRHVERAHPELGRHLERSIRTGMYCSYSPEFPTVWTVEPDV